MHECTYFTAKHHSGKCWHQPQLQMKHLVASELVQWLGLTFPPRCHSEGLPGKDTAGSRVLPWLGTSTCAGSVLGLGAPRVAQHHCLWLSRRAETISGESSPALHLQNDSSSAQAVVKDQRAASSLLCDAHKKETRDFPVIQHGEFTAWVSHPADTYCYGHQGLVSTAKSTKTLHFQPQTR